MSKKKIDSVSSIDIRKLTVAKDANSLKLSYGFQNKTIRLTKTRCNYGGFRFWFLCPGCYRRAAVLYLYQSLKCRKCHDLVYNSERESPLDRRFRKANKIRYRLGWQPGIANLDWRKPKGMHWKTFYRLRAIENAVAQCVLAGINQWIVIRKKNNKFC